MSDFTLPSALEPGFDPRNDVFNRLLKNRVVMLGTDVNDEVANAICAQLLYLEAGTDGVDRHRNISRIMISRRSLSTARVVCRGSRFELTSVLNDTM